MGREILLGCLITDIDNILHSFNGGRVFALMSDNLSVNQKTYKMFHEEYESLTVSSIVHPVENSKFKQIFTLFDPTHLFRNIRNNWSKEKTQSLEFRNPETGEMCSAKWKDLVKLYKEETDNSILRETKLDYTTLYPNNFEKQKVQYVMNIFNEKKRSPN